MPDKIIHLRSNTTGSIPTTSSLGVGEIAINVPDGKMYIQKSGSAGRSIETVIVSNSTSSIGTLTLISSSLIISGSLSVNSGSVLDLSGTTVDFDFDTLSFSGSFESIGISKFTGSVFITGSTQGGGSGHILTYNTSSGEIFFTASSAIVSNEAFELVVAASDETTALTTGTAKVTFRMPRAVTLTSVRASLTTAQTSGSIFTVDINENGTSILSTKLTIDNTEKTSTTAVTPPVISDANLVDDAEMTIDVDQIGNGTATGLKVYLIGTY
jgi:hypothetical protein